MLLQDQQNVVRAVKWTCIQENILAEMDHETPCVAIDKRANSKKLIEHVYSGL